MSVVSYLSSGLVLITGIYLTWYWYVAITEQTDQGDILRMLGNWQTAIVDRISNIGALSIAVACVVVIGITALVTRRRSAATPQ